MGRVRHDSYGNDTGAAAAAAAASSTLLSTAAVAAFNSLHSSNKHSLNQLQQQQLNNTYEYVSSVPRPAMAMATGGAASGDGDRQPVFDADAGAGEERNDDPDAAEAAAALERRPMPNGMEADRRDGSGGMVMMTAGLGGYWATLDGGERVWCSVDNR